MINELIGHINQNQIDEICDCIIAQYRRYLKYIKSKEHSDLFAEEYAPHRKQHQLSYAIVSAFRHGSNIAGFSVSCSKDNGGHNRPELHSSKLILHIQSKGFNPNSKYLSHYYRNNANGFSNEQLYCYILFEEKNDHLMKLTLCLPRVNGKVEHMEILLDQQMIVSLVS